MRTYKKRQKDKGLIVFVGRLETDSGISLLLSTGSLLRKLGYRFIFCGDGKLKSECIKLGDVKGFVDPTEYVLKAEICVCGGYLSVYEALLLHTNVVVIAQNSLRIDYYLLSPLVKFITPVSNSRQLINVIKDIRINSKKYRKKAASGYKWV